MFEVNKFNLSYQMLGRNQAQPHRFEPLIRHTNCSGPALALVPHLYHPDQD